MTTDMKHEAEQLAQLLSLHGEDADKFANAQLASRVDRLEPGQWQWSAWLDAAGRVRCLGMLWRMQDGLQLLLRGGKAEPVGHAMQRYVLRAKLQIEVAEGLRLSPGTALPNGQLERNPDRMALGLGDYSLVLASHNGAPRHSDWNTVNRLAVTCGHPWLPDNVLDKLLPPALGLYSLGAVALGKGCYPGQEMVNRLHTRGTHKLAMAHVQTSRDWKPGEDIVQEDQRIGTVLQRAHADSLVVVRHGTLTAMGDVRTVREFPA